MKINKFLEEKDTRDIKEDATDINKNKNKQIQ